VAVNSLAISPITATLLFRVRRSLILASIGLGLICVSGSVAFGQSPSPQASPVLPQPQPTKEPDPHAAPSSNSQLPPDYETPRPLKNPTLAPQQPPPGQTLPSDSTVPPTMGKEVKPLGTGAAPVISAKGVAASKPAGAAIAPLKQKRTISFSVRTALVVGGAVALGVVTALSLGTSVHPH